MFAQRGVVQSNREWTHELGGQFPKLGLFYGACQLALRVFVGTPAFMLTGTVWIDALHLTIRMLVVDDFENAVYGVPHSRLQA
jgi:hypothetical protein